MDQGPHPGPVAHAALSLADMAAKLKTFSGVPGRLERIENECGIHFFVDFAHKPEALRVVLHTLTRLKKGRLITLFGCGGDRDKEKRPMMGKIAERYSDLTIVTSDNPCTEKPEEIVEQILQ